jgi:hypothetical protein
MVIIHPDLYYQALPKDRLLAKCIMYSVYCIQLVDIVMSAYDAFQTFGYGFGSLSALGSIGLSWFTSPVITAIGIKLYVSTSHTDNL